LIIRVFRVDRIYLKFIFAKKPNGSFILVTQFNKNNNFCDQENPISV